ncbi:DNA-deoxyinosine glycosylase, partial [Candidatus Halobeggiatoa sp. HSG11]|nr:DNA-deoxyinosine glycosylase [Candidatus Halobeggiatoa sp. HSG11]
MKVGFPPIVNPTAKILILGSMPGEKSLQKQQYYAHPRNAFWYIMGKLFNFDYQADYQKKTHALIANYIALWDVLQFCE